MKALHGVKMSYRLQLTLQQDVEEPVRGMRIDDGNSQSLNAFLYSTLRSNRQNRRGFVTSLLNLFDDSSVSVPYTNTHFIASLLPSVYDARPRQIPKFCP